MSTDTFAAGDWIEIVLHNGASYSGYFEENRHIMRTTIDGIKLVPAIQIWSDLFGDRRIPYDQIKAVYAVRA